MDTLRATWGFSSIYIWTENAKNDIATAVALTACEKSSIYSSRSEPRPKVFYPEDFAQLDEERDAEEAKRSFRAKWIKFAEAGEASEPSNLGK